MGSVHRVTRRTLLRCGGSSLLAVTASALLPPPLVLSAAPAARHFAWEEHDLSLTDAPILSPTLDAPFSFNAVESHWDADVSDGASLDLFVRTCGDASDWSDWVHLHADDHTPDDADDVTFGDLVIVAPATHVQYRIEASPNDAGDLPVLQTLSFTAVDTLPDEQEESSFHTMALDGVRIVSRAGWGADEHLRFGKDGKELWPPEYRPIRKVIIHHTVTLDPDPNPRATIRAIYLYHAVSRGWGDIGYNYLIDPNGTIYEGRYGGAGVIGGHTRGYNEGSMGIAMLGTYNSHTISSAARSALKALIKAKAGNLDPHGKGFFIDRENVWNISGHRALTQTECPGDRFYPTFNNLRRESKGLPLWTGDPARDPLAASPADADRTPPAPRQPAPSRRPALQQAPIIRAVLTAVTWPTEQAKSGELVKLRLTIKNTGTAPLAAAKPAPTIVYAEGETYLAKGMTIPRGTINIGIGPAGKPNGPPYRWGLEHDVKPGESATMSVAIRLRTAKQHPLLVTLRREGYAILDESAPHTITVLADRTDLGPPPPANNNGSASAPNPAPAGR